MTRNNDKQQYALREAIRVLLLPIAPALEDVTLAEVASTLDNGGIATVDQPEFLRLSRESWKSTGKIEPLFAKAIESALAINDSNLKTSFCAGYLSLHSELQEKLALSFHEASLLLSNLRLIAHLAISERMTAAKIAKVLCSTDERLRISWREVHKVLSTFRLAPSLNLSAVKKVYEVDREFEERFFADANIQEACHLVGEKANELNFKGDLGQLLLILSGETTAFPPYLQMLFFQCLIAEFYDHRLSVLYEFYPRGKLAEWVFEKFVGLDIKGNPFLNNAKSVDVLNLSWARSKIKPPSLLKPAMALTQIISGIDQMSYADSHELSAWLRRWILRYLRLQFGAKTQLPKKVERKNVILLLNSIRTEQSKTAGIIDQRVVDVISMMRHPAEDGWRMRGVGDSVNASNISRKKLGDCDFQNPQKKVVVAYEAHGGILTEVYLKGHMRTLERVLAERTQEMQGIADIKEWQVEVVFVAQGFKLEQPKSIKFGEVLVKISFLSFSDFIDSVDVMANSFCKIFNENVIKHLNAPRTPDSARLRFLSLAGLA